MHEVFIILKLNKQDKSTEIFTPLFLKPADMYARGAVPRAKCSIYKELDRSLPLKKLLLYDVHQGFGTPIEWKVPP